jgi:hypothetical protein
VILGCRDIKTAWKVCEEITKETGNEGVYALHLDLTDFKSIDKFVEELSVCKCLGCANIFY